MKSFNERYEEFAALQRNSLKPFHQFSGVSVDTFEKIVRKNYEVIGDVVEFTVSQVQIPANGGGPQEVFEQQAEQMKAYAERASARPSEYMTILEEFNDDLRNRVDSEGLVQNTREMAGKSRSMMQDAVSMAADKTAEMGERVEAEAKEAVSQTADAAEAAADDDKTDDKTDNDRKSADASKSASAASRKKVAARRS